MRVAIVGNFGLTGNQTMAMRAIPIAQALAARGHSVCMALPNRRDEDSASRSYPGIDVRHAARPPLGFLAYVWQVLVLSWYCLRWRPDVLYCFKPIAHSGAILTAFRFLRNTGLFHGIIALDTDDWEGDGGWNEKQPFPDWLKRVVSWQERASIRGADVVMAASLELVKLARQCGAKKVVYVPNCLSGSVPLASNVSILRSLPVRPLGQPVVLVYTRFVEYRLERLLDTFRAVLSRVPEATFEVVGAGLRAEEEDLKRLVVEQGLAGRVKVVGWVKPEDLAACFASAQVALYLLDDNLLNRTKCPVKLLELTAAGVPVVADRVGQAAEYVADGQTGLLVAPGDVVAMADGVAGLLADPSRRMAMSKAARSWASSRWTWESWLPEVERALGLSPSPNS